jgi:hypothetical protein
MADDWNFPGIPSVADGTAVALARAMTMTMPPRKAPPSRLWGLLLPLLAAAVPATADASVFHSSRQVGAAQGHHQIASRADHSKVETRRPHSVPILWQAALRIEASPEQASLPVASEEEVRADEEQSRRPPIPPIWGVLKSYAYSQLPTHRRDGFKATWAPVIVRSQKDTVPGVGLVGRF